MDHRRDGRARLRGLARRLPVWLAPFALFAVLIGIWLGTNPPGSAPDEADHLVKAEAAGRLQLVGDPPQRQLTALERKQLNIQSTRIFTLPRRIFSANFGCNKFDARLDASCMRVLDRSGEPGPATTVVGTYAPFLYLPPGVAARVARGPFATLYVARTVAAGVCVALLAIAIASATAFQPGPWALAGLFLALTPTTMFLASSMNVSGAEIVASLALMAALLASTRVPDGLARMRWAIAAAGAVLVLSRTEGLAFAGLDAAIWLALGGRGAVDGARRAWRRLLVPAGVVGAAAVAVLVWQYAYGPTARFPLSSFGDMASVVWRTAPMLVRQATGMFGWFDTFMQSPAYHLWWLLLGGLVVAALVVGRAAERLTLLAIAALTAVAPILIQTVVLGPPLAGQLVQARYVMPLAVTGPLVAAEILRRHTRPAPAATRWGAGTVVLVTGLVQVDAVLLYGRRNAVGMGHAILFFRHPAWSPPLGWAPWMAAAALAAALAVLAAAVTVPRLRSESQESQAEVD